MGNVITRILRRIANLRTRIKPVVFVPENYMEYLKETTTLTIGEIRHLYNRFMTLTNKRKYLTKNDLMMVPGVQSNPINSSIIHGLFGRRRTIHFKEFAKFLHIFKAQNEELDKVRRKEEKLHLLFNMFDRNNTGTITKDELFDIVHKMFSDQLDYSEILKISEIVMVETDPTGRDEIVFPDFCTSLASFEIDTKLMLKIPEY